MVAIVSANFLSVQITVPLWLLAGIAAVLAVPGRPPQRAREGRARHVDPVRRAGRARASCSRATSSRSACRCARWRSTRRSPRASRAAGARAAVLPLRSARSTGRARCACTASCAARTWSTRTTAAAASGSRLGAVARRRCASHTLHGLPEPYLDGRPPRPEGADRLRRARARAGGAHRRADHARRTRWRGCSRERVGYALDDIVVVPNGVDVPAAPIAARRRWSGRSSAHEPVKGLEVSSMPCRWCSRAARRRAS